MNEISSRDPRRWAAAGIAMILALARSAIVAAPVVPGEYTDPTALKKAFTVSAPYETPVEFQHPYIATYYVKPTVTTAEDVEIKFYVTDWDHSLVRLLDDSHRFDVFLKVVSPGGKTAVKTLRSLKSGDHAFALGRLAKGEYHIAVWTVDLKRKTESHRVWHRFRVLEPGDLVIPADKIYTMIESDLAKYSLSNDGALGRKVLVEVPEVKKGIHWRERNKIYKEAVSKYADANPQPPRKGAPGYTIFTPAKNGEEITAAFVAVRVVYDRLYDTNAVEQASIRNAEGLQKLLEDKAAAGFKKVVLYPGTYRISAFRKVSVPSNMTFDLNGATLKQNEFAGDHSVVVVIDNAYDAHLVNGTIEGDYYEHYYDRSTNSEWPMGFYIMNESFYSSVENVHVKDITGYGGANHQGKVNGKLQKWHKSIRKYFEGALDRTTGEVVKGPENLYTSDFIPLDKSKAPAIQVSKYLGYQGVKTRQWTLTGCWYDKDKKFISAETIWQYRVIPIPEGAEFLRITQFNESLEAANKSDMYAVAFYVPQNCAIRSCIFDHCRCVGYAASAMRNFIFDGNFFTRSGEAQARCAFDAEDGWDTMHDVLFINNKCRDNPVNNSLLTCAGHNFIFEKNDCDIHFWPRTHSPCVRGNVLGEASFMCDSRVRTGYARVYDNVITRRLYIRPSTRGDVAGWDYAFNGLDVNGTNDMLRLELSDSARVVNSKFTACSSAISKAIGCTFKDCLIERMYGGFWSRVRVEGGKMQYFRHTNTYDNCSFKDVRFHGFQERCRQTFRNCTFDGCDFIGFTSSKLVFENCSFKGGYIWNAYWCAASDITFKNCTFEVTGTRQIRLGTYGIGETLFDSCTISAPGKKDVVFCDLSDWRPSKPGDTMPGSITMRNCTLGEGIAYGIGCSTLKTQNGGLPRGVKSVKPLKFKAENNTFGEGAKDLGPMPVYQPK